MVCSALLPVEETGAAVLPASRCVPRERASGAGYGVGLVCCVGCGCPHSVQFVVHSVGQDAGVQGTLRREVGEGITQGTHHVT